MRKRTLAAILVAGAMSGAVPARAQSPGGSDQPLEKIARKYLQTEYHWEGRLTHAHPGLDCLGLLFVALEKKYGISWKNWSVKPTELIRQLDKAHDKRTLLLSDSDESGLLKKLKPGDLIFLLRPVVLSGDSPAAKDGRGKNYYVWHTAIYDGGGKIMHASPFPDERGNETYRVVEESLLPFMRNNSFDGIVAVTFRK
jgi:cell wall-associated NlpC family hydrolase